jgi:hypothetical protein
MRLGYLQAEPCVNHQNSLVLVLVPMLMPVQTGTDVDVDVNASRVCRGV